MPSILINELPASARRLRAALAEQLGRIGGEEAGRLSARLRDDGRTAPVVVVTGQYSSGKSTLINALTDGAANAPIGVGPVTSTASEPYPWGDVLLVDTPGVQSRVREHDDIALDALVTADLVLFVVAPGGLDDAGARFLRYVAFELGKRDQTLIVISKKNTMVGDIAVRRQNIALALETEVEEIPVVVECDAADYLDGGEFARISGMDDVCRAMNELTERSGRVAVERQPFDTIAATADEALALVPGTERDSGVLRLIARRQQTVASGRKSLDATLARVRRDYVQQVTRAAEVFADQIDAIEDRIDGSGEADLEVAEAEMGERFSTAQNWLTEETALQIDEAILALSRDLEELDRTPLADAVRAAAAEARAWFPSEAPTVEFGKPAKPTPHIPDVAQKIADNVSTWSAQLLEAWGAGGGVWESRGTTGHLLVKKAAKFTGVKLKPWGAVKTANRIGKGMRVAGKASTWIGGVVEAFGVVGEIRDEAVEARREKARQKRRATIINGYREEALACARDYHGKVRENLASLMLNPAAEQLRQQQQDLIEARALRQDQVTAIRAIAAEARSLSSSVRGSDLMQPEVKREP